MPSRGPLRTLPGVGAHERRLRALTLPFSAGCATITLAISRLRADVNAVYAADMAAVLVGRSAVGISG